MSRNLVLVRAGDSSCHRSYTAGGGDFDVFLQYFGSQPGRYRGDVTHYEAAPADGPRNMAALQDVLRRHPSLLEDYDAFWFPDDDIEASSETVESIFTLHRELGLGISQPALTPDSYYGLYFSLQHTRTSVRFTNYVEVMAPVFSRSALETCAATFALTEGGWGFDFLWPLLVAPRGLRMAVFDCLPVRHTRPLKGGEMYVGLAVDPLDEYRELMRSFEIPPPPVAFDEVLDDAWVPVASRSMTSHLLEHLPRPTLQPPHAYDGYVEGLLATRRADEQRFAARARERGPLGPTHPLVGARLEEFVRGVRSEPSGVVDVPRQPVLEDLGLVPEFDVSAACGSVAALEDRVSDLGPQVTADVVASWSAAPVASVPEAAVQRFGHRDLRGAHARGRLARRRSERARGAGALLTVGVSCVDVELGEVLDAVRGVEGVQVVVVVPTSTAVEQVVAEVDHLMAEHGFLPDDVEVEVRATDVEMRLARDLDTCVWDTRGPWFASHPVPLSVDELRGLVGRTAAVTGSR